MAVVIKTFKTPGGNYVYDRETNSLLSVSEEEFVACQRIEVGMVSDEDWRILKNYKEQGYFQQSQLQEIIHPSTSILPFQVKKNMSQLTLQVTQNCNLRCKYCTYSGEYEYQRAHGSAVMALSTMKDCVDFLMQSSRELPEMCVGFYGGEPLLEINNIMDCVEYIKSSYPERAVRYTLTTNGTVFNEEIIDFLDANDFSVSISLDGPKDLHDINRVYSDGKGSFDNIMANLKQIKINNPSFYNKMQFRIVIAPKIDFSCVEKFFNVNEIMTDALVSRSLINTYNIKEDIVYDDLYQVTNCFQQLKMLLSEIGLYSKNKISKLLQDDMLRIKEMHKRLSNGRSMSSQSHPGGPCIPGVMRPFVSVDGTIYPCERISEGSNAMKIGHITHGIDLVKASTLLNVGKLTADECLNCWNFFSCTLCCAASDGGDDLSRDLRLKNCDAAKLNTLYEMTVLCMLVENGYDFIT
ncbi:MAG: Cys-rich peptide radical SAM maturase CcpM [Defluviitaleaceae bacterium]|nr:Cys-rich peptide radical SAM maturase CcpM [Defluviitaleaceae bacterium]MCL2275117.1 Cys-rich peptide radical SAM maturase CcpM [Defluviitaleaceae bacterium]